MIRVDGIAQGSEEWLSLRAGVITASNFDRILTPKKLQVSSSRDAYIAELAYERWTGQPIIQEPTGWMHYGQAMEPEALAWWSFQTGREVDRPAFVYYSPEKMVGCSPDAMGLELKCPAGWTHTQYLLDGKLPEKYICQVQGCMYVTGAQEWQFMSYHPSMPPLLLTVEADPVFQSRLAEELESAVEALRAAMVRIAEAAGTMNGD